jgi:hypothetical protein
MSKSLSAQSAAFGIHLIVLPGLLLLTSGCGAESHPRLAEFRDSILLDTEPGPASTIEQVHESAESDEQVILIGKVGVRKLARWYEDDIAAFAISEGTEGSDYNIGPDHDPSTCPFCKSRWKDEHSMAFVTLMDNSGKPIPVNPLTLLNVTAGDYIVVQGSASVNDSGFLEIRCDGIYVR